MMNKYAIVVILGIAMGAKGAEKCADVYVNLRIENFVQLLEARNMAVNSGDGFKAQMYTEAVDKAGLELSQLPDLDLRIKKHFSKLSKKIETKSISVRNQKKQEENMAPKLEMLLSYSYQP